MSYNRQKCAAHLSEFDRKSTNRKYSSLDRESLYSLISKNGGPSVSALRMNNTAAVVEAENSHVGHIAVENGPVGIIALGAVPAPGSRVGKNAVKSQYKYTETGEPSNLLRKTEVNGTKIRIYSGHGYNRSHSGTGDVRETGLSMNEIDDAIVQHVVQPANIAKIPLRPSVDIPITIKGHSITYRARKLPNGEISINTYFPTEP